MGVVGGRRGHRSTHAAIRSVQKKKVGEDHHVGKMMIKGRQTLLITVSLAEPYSKAVTL